MEWLAVRWIAVATTAWAGLAGPAAAEENAGTLVCSRDARSGRVDCMPRAVIDAQARNNRAAPAAPPPPPELQLYPATLVDVVDPRRPEQLLGHVLSMGAPPVAVDGSSLAPLEQALALDRGRGNLRGAVRDLLAIALVHLRSGDFAQARRRIGEAVADSGRIDDPEAASAALANLGVVQALQGEYGEAIASTERALAGYRRALEALKSAAKPRSPLQLLLDLQARLQMAQQLMAEPNLRSGIELCLVNLAAVQAQLGQFAEAFARLDAALALYPAGESSGEAQAVWRAMSAVALRAGRTEDARRHAQRAARARDTDLETMTGPSRGIELRPPPSLAEAALGRQPGVDASAPKALLAVPGVRLELFEEQALGAELEGRRADAMAAWRKLSLLSEFVGASDRLRNAQAHLQRLASAAGLRDLAIYHGKRAVAEIQRQRAAMQALSRDARRSFATTSRRVFEALADDLLEAGRLDEAERALLLLRQDDLSDVVAGSATLALDDAERALRGREERQLAALRASRVAAPVPTGLPALPPRGRIYASFVESQAQDMDQLAQQVTAIEDQLWPRPDTKRSGEANEPALNFEILREITRLNDCEGVPPDARLAAVRAHAARLLERGRTEGRPMALPFLDSAADSSKPLPANTSPRCALRVQEMLEAQAAQPDEGLLEALSARPLSLAVADRLALDADRMAMSREPDAVVALHYLVGERALRILLVSKEGRRIHDVPIGRAALEAKIDFHRSVLRSASRDAVPSARALHALLLEPVEADLRRLGAQVVLLALDGRLRYLPFAALHDGKGWLVERYAFAQGASGAARSVRAAGPWRVAAFGASAGGAGLGPLRAVPGELAGVVRGTQAGASGALPGNTWLDAAFTAGALRDALAQHYPVVHIASHFSLRDDDAAESFLLLGDGKRLSLRDLGKPEFALAGVDLLTLSACQTAVDPRNAFGQEFEGLAALMRQRGAASVLSTLWSVDDDSTALLMADFYRLRQGSGVASSKAQALRQAQIAMIQGQGGSGAPSDAATTLRGAQRPSAPAPLQFDPTRRFAHPYFWAPFVLSGDWR